MSSEGTTRRRPTSFPLTLNDQRDDSTDRMVARARFGPGVEDVVEPQHTHVVVRDLRGHRNRERSEEFCRRRWPGDAI